MFKHNIKILIIKALYYVYTFNKIQNVSFSCKNVASLSPTVSIIIACAFCVIEKYIMKHMN